MKLVLAISPLVVFAACSAEPPVDVVTPIVLPDRLPGGSDHVGTGRVIEAGRVLPPLFGGTIRALSRTPHVVVADPDRDRVLVVNREAPAAATIRLSAGDLPFRVVEHPVDGDVTVVLRGSGQLLTFNVADPNALELRRVCAEPRGIAADDRELYVACASGELQALPLRGGPVSRSARLLPDLRDVVVSGDSLMVSVFRSAEVLEVDRLQLRQIARTRLADASNNGGAAASVAWRMVRASRLGVLVTHEVPQSAVVAVSDGGYGSAAPAPCAATTSIVGNAVSLVGRGVVRTSNVPAQGLPLDVAVSADARQVAVVYANMAGQPAVLYLSASDALGTTGACLGQTSTSEVVTRGLVTSVDFTPEGTLVAFETEPPALHLGAVTIPLDGGSVADTARDAFHMVTSAGLACASCHPEGGDDAHVWTFDGLGPRRTQSLRGGIKGTAPFHWSGDMADFSTLAREVMTGRMSGPELSAREADLLEAWIDRLPAHAAVAAADGAAVARGRALFESDAVGCASCHGAVTLAGSVDVGTGGPFQTPRLSGLLQRAPFLHDGCAATLRDRFSWRCGGGDQHGRTSHLSASEIDDLVAYLETL